tara:strand:+ start:13252 stop:13470 length:219 start_codon:yes stop_codon:yes gene_type:complete
MTNDEFFAEFGMTVDQAKDALNKKKQRNQESLERMMLEVEELKGKQSLRSKLEWFQNLDKRKREIEILKNGN